MPRRHRRDVPYVWLYLYTAGKPLPLGKPLAFSSQRQGHVVAIFTHKAGRTIVNHGVSLVLSRVDASDKGVWHGTLKVAKRTLVARRSPTPARSPPAGAGRCRRPRRIFPAPFPLFLPGRR